MGLSLFFLSLFLSLLGAVSLSLGARWLEKGKVMSEGS